MNRHTLRHGDVVVSHTGTYDMYICCDKTDETRLQCVSLDYTLNYGSHYKAGTELVKGETFVCNLMDIVCASKP